VLVSVATIDKLTRSSASLADEVVFTDRFDFRNNAEDRDADEVGEQTTKSMAEKPIARSPVAWLLRPFSFLAQVFALSGDRRARSSHF
jgi:hypothetical protein